MSIKTLLFLLFLYVCLVWVGVAYFYPGPEFRDKGLLWTGLGLIGAFVFVIGSRIAAWYKSRPRRPGAAAAPKVAAPVHEDDAALKAILAEANIALAKAPAFAGNRGSAPLSLLPAYLIVGPDGSGKTSTLLNSGLEPQPLSGQPGVGTSTPLCAFWLAKNTIFVEMSGRLWTGDSGRWTQTLRILRGDAQPTRWQALMGKGVRRALDVRGVIGFCDAREFTSAASDPQKFERTCRTWQDRLRAAAEVFGADIPVYQVISRADSIPYFPDFFRRLPESEAAQVFGCTLPAKAQSQAAASGPAAEAEAQRLSASFRELYHSLAERRVVHLAHEPEAARRPSIYEFPRELKRIRTPLVQFLTEVFRPHPLMPGPRLRGYYLTATRDVEMAAGAAEPRREWTSADTSMESTRLFRSADATQMFRPADATQMFRPGEMGKNPSATLPRRTVTRWMFVSDLFHKVVLPDRIAQAAPAAVQPLERERRLALGGVAALAWLACILFVVSYVQNRRLLGEVAEASNLPPKPQGGLPTMTDLEALDRLRSEILFLRKGAPLSYHWGLYTGDRALDAARQVYFGNFQQLLLTDLNADLTGMLRTANPDGGARYDPIFRGLRTHLMISSGACKPDPAMAAQSLMEARRRIAPAARAEWQVLADRQIEFYTDELLHGNPCRITEDAAARDRAREYLRGVKGIEQIYAAVLANAGAAIPKPQKLSDLAPNYRQVLNGPADVPPVYSVAAWDAVRKAAREAGSRSPGEDCAGVGFGDGGGKPEAGVEGAILARYVSDYIEQWRKYLGGFSVVRYAGAADAARKLEILSDHNSPLLALFVLAGNHTNFPAAGQQASILEQAPVIGQLVKNAGKAKKEVAAVTGQPPSAGPAQITQAFQPVHQVVPPGSETWVWEKNAVYVDSLGVLGRAMQAIARGGGDTPDPAALEAATQAATQAAEKAMDAVKQIARGFKPTGVAGLDATVERLLEEPIVQAKSALPAPRKPGESVITALRTFCAHASVLRKYPLLPSSKEDATMADFSAMFAPVTGEVWKFVGALGEVLVKDGPLWKPKDPSKKPELSRELLEFVNRAQKISDAFFTGGSPQAQLIYTLRPKLDSAFAGSNLELELDGRPYIWTSQLQKQFSWPAPPGTKETGAVARIHLGSTVVVPFASEGGPWGIFRIMADAEPREVGSRLVEWKYVRGGNGRLEAIQPAPVRLEIVDFPGGADLFNPKFFANFQCPARAVQ